MKRCNKDKNHENIPLVSKLIILIIALAPVAVLQYIRNKYNVPHISILLPLFGTFMLFWGVLVKQKLYKNCFELFNLKKWQIALLLFVGLEVVQILLVNPNLSFDTNLTKTLYKAFFFLVIVGFTEELWFRGIWFEMFKGKFIPCVLIGSFVFGLWHLPGHDFVTFLFTSLVGFTFAVARFRGSSILSLSIAHGTIDFLNNSVFSGQLRFSFFPTLLFFVLACVFIVTILMFIFKPSHFSDYSRS